MCGIAGIIGTDADTLGVPAMTAALRHRGPDHQAMISLPHAHLGAARLRIIDLQRGDQPLVSARTGATLVFNGEIYNHRELRSELEARGHRFDTATDSEVVLRAYEQWGWRSVERLRGMYAFAIADEAKAVLARDPLGIKPLHYAVLRNGRTLAFASEIKALLRCPEVRAEIDEATLGDLRTLEYVADPTATLLQDIRSLEPGHCLEIDAAGSTLTQRAHRFAPTPEPAESFPTAEDAESRVDELLEAAVRSHRIADVPFCLTLSGGLDSTLLGIFLRQQVGAGVPSYSIGDDAAHPDLQQAAHVARELGFEHHTVLFTFPQYLDAIAPAILAGESFADGAQEYLLFREVGSRFRVALNGEGADELFGGYPEHWHAERYLARLRDGERALPLSERGASERERLLASPTIDSDAWMLRHMMGSQLTDRHLQPLDKLSMASSVEVRVPYLDHDLVGYGQRLPTSLRINRTLHTLKYVLRRVYLRRWRATAGAPGLIDAVLRKKFGFPDARRRSDGRFHEMCDRVLPEAYYRDHPRRRFLAHSTQAMWFDLFEFLFCERRGILPSDFDLLDFVAQRAGKARAAVAAAVDEIGGARASTATRSPTESRVPEAADAHPSPERAEDRSETSARVEEWLCDIVEAVRGRDVGTNGRELWFRPEAASEIELRLSSERDAPSYDRSANLAISYKGQSAGAVPPGLRDVIAAIKAIDAAPLSDIAETFRAAATRAVRRLSDATEYRSGDGPDVDTERADAVLSSERPSHSAFWEAVNGDASGPHERWEPGIARKLNVIFCDFCAQLLSGGKPLTPLHWGFWPTGVQSPSGPEEDADVAPLWAFSENLLSHVPATANRILDVGCGLGGNAKLLSQRNKLVTAISPIAHHCEMIAQARLPGVEVRCIRFEEMAPTAPYDLLLFSESVNHFPLDDRFFEHCKSYLVPFGFLLLADDLTEERARTIEQQRIFRIARTVDISANVAPTADWWKRQMRALTAYRTALMSILELQDPPVATRVRELLDTVDNYELRRLLSGGDAVPASKGRYMIYLLQRD